MFYVQFVAFHISFNLPHIHNLVTKIEDALFIVLQEPFILFESNLYLFLLLKVLSDVLCESFLIFTFSALCK
jgi:hypothetical protein